MRSAIATASLGERFTQMEETFIALGALFSGRPATMDGSFVTLNEAPLLPAPVQQPRIPLWVGGKGGPRLLRLAARHADGWNAAWRWTPEAYAERVDERAHECVRSRRPGSSHPSAVGRHVLPAG